MNKKEISEIKKQFAPDRSVVTRLCGCYVDGEKIKKTTLQEAFLSLPEEEMFKYFDIFRKNLSGTIGKNLINMDFPLETEFEGGTQNFLLKLRDSQLKDTALLDAFYDKVIEAYEYPENYLILLIFGTYDIPGKGKDNEEMFDASDEVYNFILCSICPVKLSKPGLSYHVKENSFHDRIRDWIVEMPDVGFLFPAFQDRSTDLHSLLYYTKNAEELRANLAGQLLGCITPLTAKHQKETFQTILEDIMGESCDYETVKTIHENINELIEQNKEEPEPLTLDKSEVKYLLAKSGLEEKQLEAFEQEYDDLAGSNTSLLAANLVNTRRFEVKTPDVVIHVNPDRSDLVQTKMVDGRQCLVIPVDDHVEVNGITVQTHSSPQSEN